MDELFTLIRQKKAIIFAGSGISLYAGYPTATKLAEIILDYIPQEQRKIGVTALPDVAELFCKIFDRNRLIDIIRSIFEKEPLSVEYHKLITQIPQIRTIITTNYDRMFEIAYGDGLQVVLNKEDLVHSNPDKISLLKIHGSVDKPDTILITKSDYEDFFNERKSEDLLWNEVKSLCAKYAIVFIGYSLGDSDIKHILIDIIHQIGQDHKGIFLIAPKVEDYEIEDLIKKFHIQYIDLPAESLISQLKEQIELHKIEDYVSGYLNHDEIHKMVSRLGSSCEITIDAEGTKSIKVYHREDQGPIPVEVDIKSKNKELMEQIKAIISGKIFEPITFKIPEKDDTLTFIAKGIGIVPGEHTISPQPSRVFKAILKVKNADIIFTDLSGEAFGSIDSFRINIIHPFLTISLKKEDTAAQEIGFNLNLQSSYCPLKDFLLYKMLREWKSGKPLIIGFEGIPYQLEIQSEMIQEKSDFLELIEHQYGLLKSILDIQDYFNCIFWKITDITHEDAESAELLLRIMQGNDIGIDSCSGLIEAEEAKKIIKQLNEGPDKRVQFSGKRLVKLFGVTIILDFKSTILDSYIDDAEKINEEIEKGVKDVIVTIKSRSGKSSVTFNKGLI